MSHGNNGDGASLMVRLAIGGFAGLLHPMDVLKNRMIMSGEGVRAKEYKSTLHLVAAMARNEGILSIYSGVSAGLLRQCTYGSTRLGLYTYLFDMFAGKTKEGQMIPPTFYEKVMIAFVVSSAAAAAGTPAEVCLVRMAVDGKLPPEKRRNYHNVFHALYSIGKQEGIKGVFRGLWPTIIRSCFTNVPQLVTYSQVKQLLIATGYFDNGLYAHFASSLISGFATAVCSLPADVAKTRIQNMRIVDGKPEYKGMADVMIRVVKYEGFSSLWKGFTPYYMRIGPHTILVFIFLEQLSLLYARHVLGKNKLGSF